VSLQGKLSKIKNNSLVRNAGWMVAGQGGNFFLQAICFILLARLLGVTEYGIFAGAFALVNAVAPYSALGSQMIFMRYVSDDRSTAQTYWGNVLLVTAGSTLLLTVILVIASSTLFEKQSTWLIITLVLSNCFMVQIGSCASTIFQTFEQLKATAWLKALTNFLRLLAVAILLALLRHATALQCSVGLLAGTTTAAVVAMVAVHRAIGPMRVSGTLFRQRFWEGIGFSFAGSTQAAYNDIDKVMLSHYGMNTANGIYTMAYRVVDFATTPVTAIDMAVLPRYFILNNSGFADVLRLSRKIIPIAALSGLAAAGITLLSSPFAVKLAGHGFAAALLPIRWLCWLPVFRGIHQLAGGVLTSTGRQNYRTAAQFLIAVFNFGLNLAWIPSHGWLGAAWSSLASDGLLGVLNLSLVFLVASRATTHKLQPVNQDTFNA
jgi:O-antigen/teichoic acid export membrane protein